MITGIFTRVSKRHNWNVYYSDTQNKTEVCFCNVLNGVLTGNPQWVKNHPDSQIGIIRYALSDYDRGDLKSNRPIIESWNLSEVYHVF